jgi:hypothetical protein
MSETVGQKIERFYEHFTRHVASAASISRTRESDVFARIIFTSMLDTFSKVSANDPDDRIPSGKRFTNFIIDRSGWSDATRVSLLHLDRALQRCRRPEFSRLCSWVAQSLSAALPETPNSVIAHPAIVERPITFDPWLKEIRQYWPNENSAPIDIKSDSGRVLLPQHFTHAELLWRYRCHLTHEFRVPGDGWDVRGAGEPYYQSMAQAEISEESGWVVSGRHWELVYTLGFLCQLCGQSIDKLLEQLSSEGRNPFQAFKFGSYWLPALN